VTNYQTLEKNLSLKNEDFEILLKDNYLNYFGVSEANITLKLACKRQVRSVNFLPF